MVPWDLYLEDVSDMTKELEFLESMVQYLKGEIGAPPRGFYEPLRSKVMKSCNLDPVEDCPWDKLDGYNFGNSAEEFRSKYSSSDTSDKHRRELPILHHHKIMVIYPYPFWVVITQLFS